MLLLYISAMTFGLIYPTWANSPNVLSALPADFDRAFKQIAAKSKNMGMTFPPEQGAQTQVTADHIKFTSFMPLEKPISPMPGDIIGGSGQSDGLFRVDTIFARNSQNIIKRVQISQGKEGARLRYTLINQGEPFEQTAELISGLNVQVYNRPQDMFVYFQTAEGRQVQTKEWIYARAPNAVKGSAYQWILTTEEFKRRLVLNYNDSDGTIDLQRQIVVDGIDPQDYVKQRRSVQALKTAFKKDIRLHIVGEDTVGKIPPVVYWTKEGIQKKADLVISNRSHLSIEIHEPPGAYPLLIDPTTVIEQ